MMPDHVHMLISIPPKYSVAEVIGYLKGKSSIWIAQKWNASCAISWGTNSGRGATSSRPSGGMRRRSYIRNQELADRQLDQMQLKLASS
ncbi:putative transposase [Mesorhizobium shonense]|uniref:Transposase n=1 Tax=Mesorhizobium shonense TaxID=1209948 RepID=A0ABV2I1W8_9HYPH